jgi:hypothetical protein
METDQQRTQIHRVHVRHLVSDNRLDGSIQFCNLQIHPCSLGHTPPQLLWLPSVDRMSLNCWTRCKHLMSRPRSKQRASGNIYTRETNLCRAIGSPSNGKYCFGIVACYRMSKLVNSCKMTKLANVRAPTHCCHS